MVQWPQSAKDPSYSGAIKLAAHTRDRDRGSLQRQHVLVVEDDEILRSLMGMLLDDAGWTHRAFEHGAAALEHLRGTPRVRPDLVLLDLQMPVMNGVDFIRELRRDAEMADILVIGISAQVRKRGDASFAAGCDAFISKPFDPDTFMMRVREIVDAQRR